MRNWPALSVFIEFKNGNIKSQKENSGTVHLKFSKTVSASLDYCPQKNHDNRKRKEKHHDVSSLTIHGHKTWPYREAWKEGCAFMREVSIAREDGNEATVTEPLRLQQKQTTKIRVQHSAGNQ